MDLEQMALLAEPPAAKTSARSLLSMYQTDCIAFCYANADKREALINRMLTIGDELIARFNSIRTALQEYEYITQTNVPVSTRREQLKRLDAMVKPALERSTALYTLPELPK